MAELREPVALDGGPFALWLKTNVIDGGATFAGSLNTPSQLQFDRELGAMIRGDMAAEKSSEAFYEGQPPFGDAVLRVRRDVDGEVWFKWSGMSDEQPASFNSLGRDPVTFTHLLAWNSNGVPGNLDGRTEAGHPLILLRIDAGEPTPLECAAIEIELFGAAL
jgi:hypothetical protein